MGKALENCTISLKIVSRSLNCRNTFVSKRISGRHASPLSLATGLFTQSRSPACLFGYHRLLKHPHPQPSHDICLLTFLSVTKSFSAAVRLFISSSYLLRPKTHSVRLVLFCLLFSFPFPGRFTKITLFSWNIKHFLMV